MSEIKFTETRLSEAVKDEYELQFFLNKTWFKYSTLFVAGFGEALKHLQEAENALPRYSWRVVSRQTKIIETVMTLVK